MRIAGSNLPSFCTTQTLDIQHKCKKCGCLPNGKLATMKITNNVLYIHYFIIPSRLYMFRAMFSPIIRNTWLFTVSGSVHPSCYQLVSWMSWNWTMWIVRRVYTAHNQDTSRQQLGWTLPDTVNTANCSWWWAQMSPETCRADLE